MANKKWNNEETFYLIELYGENFAQLEKMVKKKPIYLKISEKMKEQGYDRNAVQVQKKISNLRQLYKENQPGPTGSSKPTWIFYDALHKILHERPALNSDAAVASEIGLMENAKILANEAETDHDQDQEHEVLASMEVVNDSTRLKKKPRLSEETLKMCTESLEFMKSHALAREKEREETRDMNFRLLGILDRIATSSETMANAMINQSYTKVSEPN